MQEFACGLMAAALLVFCSSLTGGASGRLAKLAAVCSLLLYLLCGAENAVDQLDPAQLLQPASAEPANYSAVETVIENAAAQALIGAKLPFSSVAAAITENGLAITVMGADAALHRSVTALLHEQFAAEVSFR